MDAVVNDEGNRSDHSSNQDEEEDPELRKVKNIFYEG